MPDEDNASTAASAYPSEYDTIVLTIDPHSVGRPRLKDGKSIQKMVMSDESVLSAVNGLVRYYGEDYLLLNGVFAELCAQAGQQGPDVIWVYQTKVNCEIILSVDTMDALSSREDFGSGSWKQTVEKLTFLAAQQQEAAMARTGSVVPLLFFGFDLEKAPSNSE